MKISVLIDNIENGSLVGEWGLAIYIEHNGRKILLDTIAAYNGDPAAKSNEEAKALLDELGMPFHR